MMTAEIITSDADWWAPSRGGWIDYVDAAFAWEREHWSRLELVSTWSREVPESCGGTRVMVRVPSPRLSGAYAAPSKLCSP